MSIFNGIKSFAISWSFEEAKAQDPGPHHQCLGGKCGMFFC